MNDKQITLPVTEIQRFCMHDGPGVRTVVFLKGCPLRCAWCHNPETQKGEREMLFYANKCISCGACVAACSAHAHKLTDRHEYDRASCIACGQCAEVCCTAAISPAARDMTVDEILSAVLRDRAFYGDLGGVTVSGGEPMAHPKETIALLSACKAQGMTTALETCGYFSPEHLPKLCVVTDLFLWDIKDTDDRRHKAHTGVSNDRIIENLLMADALGARTRLRCILVDGINTAEDHARGLCELYGRLKYCEGVELIPYHAYGGSKMLPFGLEDNGRADWIPSEHTVERVKQYLMTNGVHVVNA